MQWCNNIKLHSHHSPVVFCMWPIQLTTTTTTTEVFFPYRRLNIVSRDTWLFPRLKDDCVCAVCSESDFCLQVLLTVWLGVFGASACLTVIYVLLFSRFSFELVAVESLSSVNIIRVHTYIFSPGNRMGSYQNAMQSLEIISQGSPIAFNMNKILQELIHFSTHHKLVIKGWRLDARVVPFLFLFFVCHYFERRVVPMPTSLFKHHYAYCNTNVPYMQHIHGSNMALYPADGDYIHEIKIIYCFWFRSNLAITIYTHLFIPSNCILCGVA